VGPCTVISVENQTTSSYTRCSHSTACCVVGLGHERMWSTVSITEETVAEWIGPKGRYTLPCSRTLLTPEYTRPVDTGVHQPCQWPANTGSGRSDPKARSTLATMSKQHCRSNRQLYCLLLRQCCRFGQHCRTLL